MRYDPLQYLPATAVEILFVVAPIWFAVLYRRGAAGKPGFGPAQVISAVVMFFVGCSLLIWSVLAALGIVSTRLG